jgi:uncharacterized protein
VGDGRSFVEHLAEDVTLTVTGPYSTKAGAAYDNHFCLLYRLEGGKIREIREDQDSSLCERVLGPYPNIKHT